MAQLFKKGTKVNLKSGGPLMTVEGYRKVKRLRGTSYENEEVVSCVWFDKNNKLKWDDFPQDFLIEVKE